MNGLKVREPLRALAFPGQTACSCCATDMLGSIRQSTVNACLAFSACSLSTLLRARTSLSQLASSLSGSAKADPKAQMGTKSSGGLGVHDAPVPRAPPVILCRRAAVKRFLRGRAEHPTTLAEGEPSQ